MTAATRPLRPVRALVLLSIVACGGGGDAPPPAEPVAAPKASGPSIVLITLDTTRADHIGAYGYKGAVTPVADALAADGVRFDRAYATVPLTTPSHASMLTGLYPPRHGIHNNGDAVLPESIDTLAEHLQRKGYRTAGAVSAFVTTSVWQLNQGFDAYFDDVNSGSAKGGRWSQERPAGDVVDDLTGWLSAQPAGEPFFVWAHFYDAHDPYEPPEPWAQRMPRRPYDGEIAYVDEQMGRLKAAVDAATGPEGAAWIVIADHGEAVRGEHGETTHGLFLFDPTMRVPFIVRPAGGMSAPVAVTDRTVSGVDVMPTALGMLGVDVPEGLDGVDLSPYTRGGTAERAPVYMESESVQQRFGYHPEIAVAEGHHKLMNTPEGKLFDLAADPGETTDTRAANPAMAASLAAYSDQIRATAITADATSMAPEVAEQLAALGYVSHDIAASADAPTIDAKTQLETIVAIEKARFLNQKNKPVEAEAAYRAVLAEQPQLGEALMGLSRALTQQGKLAESEVVLREAVEREPSSTVLRSNLANALAAQGRHEEGYDLMKTIHDQVPGDAIARQGMLRMLTDAKRGPEAIELGKQWLETDPDDLNLHAILGVAMVKEGNLPGGKVHLTRALEDGQPRQMVHLMLSRVTSFEGDSEATVEHLRLESAWFPRDRETREKLATLLMKRKNWDEAATEWRHLLDNQPTDKVARLGQAQCIFNVGDYTAAAEILAPALSTPDSEILLLHANILSKLGQTDEAKAVFERAKKLRAQEAARAPKPSPASAAPSEAGTGGE